MIALDCNMRQPNQGFAPGRVREDLQRGNGFVSFFLARFCVHSSEPQVAIVSAQHPVDGGRCLARSHRRIIAD